LRVYISFGKTNASREEVIRRRTMWLLPWIPILVGTMIFTDRGIDIVSVSLV
jgi:hypothetical protein